MILFTADWHLKLGQKNVPVQWATNRYYEFFNQVRVLEEDCILHIVGGDLFDRLPTMQELEIYFSFVAGSSIPTMIYDGNHCATRKNKTFLSNLKEVTNKLNPLVSIVDKSTIDMTLGFGILPYVDIHKPKTFDFFDKSMPLFTHVRGEIPPHVKPEIDLSLFKDFPVVFAGDLHSHSNSQGNIVYPGSPMTTSFHRNQVETGCLLIDESSWEWEWHPFDLPQLLRKTVTSEDEMLKTAYHHTIYEIEGDLQGLSLVKDSELLDKKIIKRNTDTALVMSNDMTIEEELSEYLTYILELPDSSIPNIISTFKQHTKR